MIRSYKPIFVAVALLIIAFSTSAQTNSVSIGTPNTNPSAVLWLNSPNGNQGLIIPVGSRANVASPVKGMLIYDTNQVYAYDGANWNPVGSGGSGLPTPGANQILTSNGSSVPTWASTISGSQVTPNFGATTVTGLTVSGATTTLNNKTYTWPNNPTLTAGSVLQTDASGNLTWSPAASSSYAAGTGLTLTSNTFSVNTSQNISTLSNLVNNGLIKTSGGTGALSIATAGTDYIATESDPAVKAINGIVKSNGTTIGAVVSGTDIKTINSTSLLGSGNINVITSETDPAVKAINGLVKSNGTTISAAIAGTDYVATEADPAVKAINGIVKSNGTTIGAVVSGTDIKTINSTSLLGSGNISVITSETDPAVKAINGLVKSNGTTISAAIAGTDYVATEVDPAVKAINGIVKSNGTTISAAVSGTDYLTPFASQTAKFFYAAPNGSAGTPLFRAIVASDIPTLNQSTTGSAGSVANALTVDNTSLQLSSGTTYNGSAASTISVKALGITNAMLAGSIASSKLVGTDIATVGTITAGTWNGIKISEAFGGTNQTSYAAGDILYASTPSTLSKLAIGSPGQVLTINAGGTAPFWASATSSGWSLSGNGGTTPGTNFIGTTDPNDLVFKTNGVEGARLSTSGYLGIGTNIPGTPLHVVWNAASNINPVATIETSGAGSSASLRYRNASSQSYTMGVLGSGDFAISQLNYNVSVNDMVRISSAGNMGIKQSVPTEVLDVGGNVKFSGALMPNNASGVAGQVLTSSGPGAPPVWKGSKSAFRAFTSITLALATGSQTIPFNTLQFDVNNDFSVTNNSFVAPVKGLYSFSWRVYYNNTGSAGNYVYLHLEVNGGAVLNDVYNNSGTVFPHLSGSTTLFLQAGDKVRLTSSNDAATGTVESSNAYTEFSGFLIFEN